MLHNLLCGGFTKPDEVISWCEAPCAVACSVNLIRMAKYEDWA